MHYKFQPITTPTAPKGRRPKFPDITKQRFTLTLERMKLVEGDYDNGGAYWGGSHPWWILHGHGVEVVIKGRCDEAWSYATKTITAAYLAAFVRSKTETVHSFPRYTLTFVINNP